MNKLKINFHLLEECNYHCKFCFAKYEHRRKISLEQQKAVIKNIADSSMFDAINFAGGEPTLVKHLPELMKYACSLGLKVSVITNGYLLTREKLDAMLPYLSMLGISVHSFDDATKCDIGSCTRDGKVLTNERLAEICEYIHVSNESGKSDCRIKINSVICKSNCNENLVAGIRLLKYIQRWKGLRCQIFECNQDMLVTDSEYQGFVRRNQASDLGQVFENDMKDTYIMINPYGELLKDGADGKSYEVVGSALREPMKLLMSRFNLKEDIFQQRYAG